MASTTAISSQTAAANSSLISIAAGSSIQVFTSAALAVGETIQVECTPDGGSTWIDVIDPKWSGRFLGPDADRLGNSGPNVTRNSLSGPGDFRLVKSATSASIAVYYDS